MKKDPKVKDIRVLKYNFDNKYILFEFLFNESYCPLPQRNHWTLDIFDHLYKNRSYFNSFRVSKLKNFKKCIEGYTFFFMIHYQHLFYFVSFETDWKVLVNYFKL